MVSFLLLKNSKINDISGVYCNNPGYFTNQFSIQIHTV